MRQILPWRQSCCLRPVPSPRFSLHLHFSLIHPASPWQSRPSGPLPFRPRPCRPFRTLEELPPRPGHRKNIGNNGSYNLRLSVSPFSVSVITSRKAMYFLNKHSCAMYRAARTWTGSVTFGAGSDDPPPNKVEMVLPSSERRQSVSYVIMSPAHSIQVGGNSHYITLLLLLLVLLSLCTILMHLLVHLQLKHCAIIAEQVFSLLLLNM